MDQFMRIEAPLPDEPHTRYVYRNLRQNIMEFHLKPGELINEGALASALGVSRTPVHEAVLALRDEALIDVIPRRESRVSRLRLALVSEGVFARCAMETALLRSLAGNVSPEMLEKMQENLTLQGEIFESGKDLERYYPADDAFHHLMYQAANKPHGYATIRTLCAHLDRMRFFVRLENDTEIEAQSLAEHRQMLLYLTLGLPPQTDLEALWRQHILRFQTKLSQYLARYPVFFIP